MFPKRDCQHFIATVMGIRLPQPHAQKVEGIVGDPLAKLIFKSARDVLSRGAQRKDMPPISPRR
jgi:hypothetical protein